MNLRSRLLYGFTKEKNAIDGKEPYLISNGKGNALLAIESSGRFKTINTNSEEMLFSSTKKPEYFTGVEEQNWSTLNLGWHSVTIRYNAMLGSLVLFVDGVGSNPVFGSIGPSYKIRTLFGYGSKHSKHNFDDSVSCAFAYSGALEAEIIQENYNKLKYAHIRKKPFSISLRSVDSILPQSVSFGPAWHSSTLINIKLTRLNSRPSWKPSGGISEKGLPLSWLVLGTFDNYGDCALALEHGQFDVNSISSKLSLLIRVLHVGSWIQWN